MTYSSWATPVDMFRAHQLDSAAGRLQARPIAAPRCCHAANSVRPASARGDAVCIENGGCAMLNRLFSLMTAAVIFGIAWNSFGEASEPDLPRSTSAPVGAETSIPYGWVDFCNRHAEECALGRLTPVDVRLTKQVWKTLNEVNAFANGAIEPLNNFEHWGATLDHWDYPVDGKGDCKIYALFKRKLLIERGFPRQPLLMTIVRDLNGEGHAVLTVKTDRGDFVLDNLSPDVRPWSATGYQFFKRQAQHDPNVWLSLSD